MEFKIIDENIYQKFWESHPLKTFLSSIEIGKIRIKNGWDGVVYTGVYEDNNLLAAAMLIYKKRKLGVFEYYSPRGLLLDYSNFELLNFYIKNLKKYIRKNKGYVLRIDPYIINRERDIDGNIVENGIDNTYIVNYLLKLGFKKKRVEEREQVGWMFSLDLEGKTEEDILSNMRQNTRNTIKKVLKMGIDIDEIDYDDLDSFYKILVDTAKRKSFETRDISYYQEMYKEFSNNEVKFFIARLNINKCVLILEKEKEEKQEKLLNIKKEGQRNSINEEIKNIEKRITELEELRKKENKDVIDLSGSMFILIKPEIVYLSSGNYIEYMKYNSQYLIQWELIKYGIKNSFKKYNFYGIPDNINTHPKDYGIYEFKKGFDGYVEELIGEYDLVINIKYYLLKIIHKFKKNRG